MAPKFRLGINTGFAINRFPEPEEWVRVVGEFLGLRYVQFTATLLSPSLPENIIQAQVRRIKKSTSDYGVSIPHTFTDAYTQLSHLAHPDKEVRKYWIEWFKKFVDISAELGAESMGSHMGIFSTRDIKDEKRRQFIFEENLRGWAEISDHAKAAGIKYLTWEPMSVAREQGETLAEAKRIHEAVNRATSIPMKICLDVDHGLKTSGNPDDINPYAWIKIFGRDLPILHIKQTYGAKGGPFPFTPQYNREGIVNPEKIIAALEESGVEDCLLAFEISGPGRESWESNLLDDIKVSVDYWRNYVKG